MEEESEEEHVVMAVEAHGDLAEEDDEDVEGEAEKREARGRIVFLMYTKEERRLLRFLLIPLHLLILLLIQST